MVSRFRLECGSRSKAWRCIAIYIARRMASHSKKAAMAIRKSRQGMYLRRIIYYVIISWCIKTKTTNANRVDVPRT